MFDFLQGIFKGVTAAAIQFLKWPVIFGSVLVAYFDTTLVVIHDFIDVFSSAAQSYGLGGFGSFQQKYAQFGGWGLTIANAAVEVDGVFPVRIVVGILATGLAGVLGIRVIRWALSFIPALNAG